MMQPIRYPHVKELIEHYAREMSDSKALFALEMGINSESEAKYFSHFIWRMVDQMAEDREAQREVLGATDNTSMLPDVSYEVGHFMDEQNYSHVWEAVSDEM